LRSSTRSVRTAQDKLHSGPSASDKTKPSRSPPARAGTGNTTGWGRSQSGSRPGSKGTGSRRKFFVFVSLVGLLSLTSVLLLALAPAPLTPGTATSLFALDQPRSMDAVFETAVPVVKQRWGSIYIHHSRTASGSAHTLASRAGGPADHFVIGNGSGCVDGEVQIGQRWSAQLAAGEIPGTISVAGDCISICVVGDFDHSKPTPTQQMRLAQLVDSLQSRLGIPADRVYLHQGSGSAADIGARFPVAAFRRQLLP
jgi:hypothetical protein